MKEFEIILNVPMECEKCVEAVTKALTPLKLSSINVDLEQNIVATKGGVAPSTIVKTIQETGKDAIIRGTGQPNSAAVCILESFDDKDFHAPVKGLARIVNVNDSELFIDLTVNGLPKGTYYPSIRSSGNLSQGALSTGDVYYPLEPIEVTTPSSSSTIIESLGASKTPGFSGQSFLYAKLTVSDLIGRSVVLSELKDKVTKDSLVGVIARSAGAWENSKMVCSCSGKTVWEERKDALAKGLRG